MKRNLLKSLFLGLSISFLAQFTFAQITTTPASGPNVCDGTAAVSNPSSVIQSSITWYGNGAIIATNTYQIGNLCPGNYNISLVQTNPTGGLDSINYSFLISGGVNPCANFNASITQTPCSTPTSNDGVLNGNATGGTPPYFYSWSNGANTQNLINLLPGYNYCLLVQDAAGCNVTVCDSLEILNSTMGDTLVVNGANCGPSNTTFYTAALEDCNFDFNACASANLYYAMYLSNDTVQSIWNFIDTNGIVTNYTVNINVPNAFSYIS